MASAIYLPIHPSNHPSENTFIEHWLCVRHHAGLLGTQQFKHSFLGQLSHNVAERKVHKPVFRTVRCKYQDREVHRTL